jgi:predicted AlkP superfamily phosphohydrolase/phosphomutase
MEKKNKKKLVIIGIDGATFDVMNPFFEKGILPNISSFKNKGVLTSILPPATAVAWASFATGNYPGKTEIYDFTVIDDASWKVHFINRKRLQGKPIWSYLDESKIRSCFINMPLTYPPDKINGVIISGIETPSKMHPYVYPPELKEDLKKIGYEIEVSGLKNKREEILEEALHIFEKRLETTRFLLKKDFDFFFVLFRASDITQHFAWGKQPVEDVYKKIDEFIGEVKKDYEVIVMSDHGFEAINKAFNANAWLEKEGYLKSNLKGKSILSYLGINRKRIFWVLEKTKLNFLIRFVPRSIGTKIPTDKINFEEAISLGIVDMAQTKAIAKRAVKTAQIFLNNEKRGGIVKPIEEEELKEEIKSKLLKFFEDKKIKAVVKTKEELYEKDSKYAPDITVYMEEKGYDTYCYFSQSRDLFIPPIESQDAEHNLYGVIFSNLNLKLNNANITDLAPTILDYFGIKKGKFDGKSLL